MKSPLPLAVSLITLLAIALVVLPVGPSHAQGTADVSLEQRVQAALAKAGFDPGPADGKFGPKTRRAIQAWQRANGYDGTGYLSRQQLKSILTKAPPTVRLEPKCAELPGQYLGESHAECWEEVENQPGCFLWRSHYHSDQITKWTGQCRNGVAEGRGTYSVSAGSEHSSYEAAGMLLGGKANGYWTATYGNGDHYEGDYRDGKRHGRGKYTWASGSHYEGDFRDGKRTGRGKYTWANGNRYEGEYRDGKRAGRGKYSLANGDHYEGLWHDGKIQGPGVFYDKFGRAVAAGVAVDGCFGERDGHWFTSGNTPEACGFK